MNNRCCVNNCPNEGIFWQEDGYDDDEEFKLCARHQDEVNAAIQIAKARQTKYRSEVATLRQAINDALEAWQQSAAIYAGHEMAEILQRVNEEKP